MARCRIVDGAGLGGDGDVAIAAQSDEQGGVNRHPTATARI